MKAFVTGSRAYGTPHEKSDIDLVVLVSPEDMHRLIEAIPPDGSEGQYAASDGEVAYLRFGVLNLLCVTDERDYEVWREGTEELVARQPVTRDEALALFRAKREAEMASRIHFPA